MRKISQPFHAITGVFVFLLLGIFAVFSTVMVMLGARAYKGTVEQLEAHNGARIAPAYLRSMVRADDERAVISVEETAGVTALTLLNEYDGEAYVTRIYCYEGQLYEWFTEAANEFVPEEGEPVCPCGGMTAEVKDEILSVRLLNGDEWINVDIALRAIR